MKSEHALAERLFDEIAALGPDSEGVSRPAFSEVETRVLEYLEGFARDQGLHVETDAGQNRLFSLPEHADAKRYVLVGSHVDSVPRGGNFDGLAGVVASLLCLIRARDADAPLPRPVKAIAMRGEESAWFGPCYIASKCLTGTLTDAELAATHRDDGRSLGDHMADVGVDTDRVRAHKPLMDLAEIAEYIELHIEQGPLLIEKNLPAAVISGIRGNIRHRRVRCIGEAGHSGAVPRAYRRDPVLAMADLLVRLDESWLTIVQKGDDLVLTAGMVSTDPAHHGMARIADKVDFSLDIRSQSGTVLDQMRALLADEMRQIERERKVRFEASPEMLTPPALMDAGVVKGLSEAMGRAGMEPFVMPSGGGHDAAVFANAGVPAGMVFVRNRGGSHNPGEVMEIDDFLKGVSIISEYLARAA
jgi:N-carbamoyl-L-amino-acid hydrolase